MENRIMPDKAKDPENQHDVPFYELLNNSFISRNSSFSSIEELFESSGFRIESQEDFEAIPDNEWNEFINKNTSFHNWKDMLNAAGEEWAKKQIR